ncbi:3-hydroxyacyl-CoA dehydrogenase/enoyl-CoA hydratase family protein [Lichenicoccus roseus]|uniref:3-hydroxyacyl-CoA dehydrogenase n=1 Tax=Lichenicoccus roseus TaxID=2683649 RepID=A0A5R9J8R6_9PROT|nr:3-hydroxyacyl-CoA dehydrogenase/enoyl-CoA hydratase family protein [Lichenicoccus roseus]TLU71766.1 3-hydroxyacyl-CoA dehydrogenase [Lichenicoccus roseus]
MASATMKRVCVIGAGVMGAAIAAQVANAGVRVLLLDILPKDEGADRSGVARAAIARMLKTDPAPFMSPAAAKLVEAGNIEDDLGRVVECDWVIEAIVERLDAKQALYRRLDAVRRPGTAISSNTSTIPLAQLIEGLPEALRRDFMITHFFNPPRYMRLLEIVASPHTDADLVERIAQFSDHRLGKTVVRAKDTPGFIANRIGTFWLQHGVNAAVDLGLTVEEADAVMGRPFGIPKTGVFGLLDLVGLDLMPHINASMKASLPADDAFLAALRESPLLSRMIADGYTGRKGRGGFYRINKTAGRVKESIGLVTGDYGASSKATVPTELSRSPKALIASTDKLGRYAWTVMGATLAYAASLVPAIADDIVAVDAAMRLGFNWKQGPFELLDALGPKAVAARLEQDGQKVPALLRQAGEGTFYRVVDGETQFLGTDGAYRAVPREPGVLLLADIKRTREPELRNGSAALWDIGDGIACFEFSSKMNAIDEPILKLLEKSLDVVKQRFRALVIYSDATNFSAGANLGLALFACNIAAWGEIEKLVSTGQRTLKAMKYAPFPVVAATAGLALGGGCEVTLHADAVQAHAESYIGLVECGVGLVPGWGGCGEMLQRWRDAPGAPHGPMPAPGKVFETVSVATVSKSAAEAKSLRFLRETDGITMNRDRLLFDARTRALALAEDYTPPKPPEFRLPGAGGRLAMSLAAQGYHRQGIASAHDLVVADGLAEVLTGGNADYVDTVTEKDLLALERKAFMRLIRTGPTLDRIQHTLETGKPLRN